METKAHTYTVPTPFGTFTRTTHHTYTHVVVVCGRNNETLHQTIADAERRYKLHTPAPHQLDWLEGVRRELAASVIDQQAKTGKALTWSHSQANAQGAATRARRLHNVVGVFKTAQEAGTK